MALHDNIRQLRELNNWSQEEMAEQINMSKNGYAKIERGESKTTIEKLEQIANVFQIDVLKLIESDKKGLGVFYLLNDNIDNSSNYYHDSQSLANEVEKQKMLVQHKDEIIEHLKIQLEQKDNEIETLKKLVELLQSKN